MRKERREAARTAARAAHQVAKGKQAAHALQPWLLEPRRVRHAALRSEETHPAVRPGRRAPVRRIADRGGRLATAVVEATQLAEDPLQPRGQPVVTSCPAANCARRTWRADRAATLDGGFGLTLMS